MSRAFVIHLHRGHGPEHYDLMIEAGEVLTTWQLSADPADLAPSASVPARKLPDHRKAYLTYEGPVSRDRGTVTKVDEGTCDVSGAEADRWQVTFHSRRLQGNFEIRRIEADGWTLTRLTAGGD